MNGETFQWHAREYARVDANGSGMQILQLTGLETTPNWSAKFNSELHFMGGKGCTYDSSEIPLRSGVFPETTMAMISAWRAHFFENLQLLTPSDFR